MLFVFSFCVVVHVEQSLFMLKTSQSDLRIRLDCQVIISAAEIFRDVTHTVATGRLVQRRQR